MEISSIVWTAGKYRFKSLIVSPGLVSRGLVKGGIKDSFPGSGIGKFNVSKI